MSTLATIISTDHQTNTKARVAAAAAPKTRISNAVIVPDEDWAVGLAEVDGVTGLALVTAVVRVGVDPPVLLPAVLVALTVNVLEEFAAMVDDKEVDAAKDGGGTTSAILTSAPVPQVITVPSASVVLFVGGVVTPADVAIANRPVPVQDSFNAAGAMN